MGLSHTPSPSFWIGAGPHPICPTRPSWSWAMPSPWGLRPDHTPFPHGTGLRAGNGSFPTELGQAPFPCRAIFWPVCSPSLLPPSHPTPTAGRCPQCPPQALDQEKQLDPAHWWTGHCLSGLPGKNVEHHWFSWWLKPFSLFIVRNNLYYDDSNTPTRTSGSPKLWSTIPFWKWSSLHNKPYFLLGYSKHK